MKTLILLALLMASSGMAVGIYGNVETLPNWESVNAEWSRLDLSDTMHSVLGSSRAEYVATLGWQALACGVLGGLALIVGVAGVVKKVGSAAFLAVLGGLIALGLALPLLQGL